MKKFLTYAFVFIIGIGGFIGVKYYTYVTNTESPYDEIGIELNVLMPGPIRDWGCSKLKETFGQSHLAPHGCQIEDEPGVWR